MSSLELLSAKNAKIAKNSKSDDITIYHFMFRLLDVSSALPSAACGVEEERQYCRKLWSNQWARERVLGPNPEMINGVRSWFWAQIQSMAISYTTKRQSYGFKSAWCRHCCCQIVSAQAGFPVEMANFLEYLMALQEEERRFVRESFHRNKCTWLVRQLRRTGRIHRRAQYKERIPRRGSSRYPRKDTQRKATLKISKKGK